MSNKYLDGSGVTYLWAKVREADTVPVHRIDNTVSSQTLNPNELYIFSDRQSGLTLTLGTPTSGIVNEYHFIIAVNGSSTPTISLPGSITWNGGAQPAMTPGATYEVSIMESIGTFIELI